MDNTNFLQKLQKLRAQAFRILFFNSVFSLVSGVVTFGILVYEGIEESSAAAAGIGVALFTAIVLTLWQARRLSQPFAMLAQAFQRISPSPIEAPPPRPEKLKFAKGVTTALITALYSFHERTASEAQTDAIVSTQLNPQTAEFMDLLAFPAIALKVNGAIVYANQNALDLIGRKREEVDGSLIDMMLPLRQKDSSIILPWLEECQFGKIKDQALWQDIDYMNSQRREYVFDVYGHYSRSAQKSWEAILILVDRTAEHEFENMKVDFVSLAAHELRAPITVIRGYIEVLEEELDGQLTDEHRKFFEKVKVSGIQLAGFINNILDASRADRGRLNLHFAKTSWQPILQNSIDNMSLQAEALGRKITLTIDPNLPEVMVDSVSIVEVVNNLVDNAIKYSPKGGVITVRSGAGDNGGIVTEVTDQGIGIPGNLMDKLFTKFYRSHRSRQQFSGTGLGLYLSKAIIEAHRGNIWADSREGEGSTFSFWLPPAQSVANELISPENKLDDVTRGPHGWIKNHSLYRR